MKIKHFTGYGFVNATKIKDPNCTLHIRVEGDHEQGLKRDDLYDVFNWLIKRFDKRMKEVSYADFHNLYPSMQVYYSDPYGYVCEYMINYELP